MGDYETTNSIDSRDYIQALEDTFGLKDVDIRTFSGLPLAYIGDAVYEVVIRTMLLEMGNRPVNNLHREATKYVKAEAQARMVEAIKEFLTEEEADYVRKGRNTHPHTTAKNASVEDYHMATGFEALIGYLYLKGQNSRILELVRLGIEKGLN